MINSTNPLSAQPATPEVALNPSATYARPAAAAADRLSTDSAEFLKAKMADDPAVRPDMVARGRQLAADPNYPSAQVIGSVARQILQAPDLSEDQS
jgi:hypothetical protein